MSKIYADAAAALEGVLADGMTLAVGGFGLCGIPADLIDAVRDSGVRDLTVVSNNMGIDGLGLGVLLESGQVRKVLSSYVGENKLFAAQYLAARVEVEFNPQGTLAERLRAGGAGIRLHQDRGRHSGCGRQAACGLRGRDLRPGARHRRRRRAGPRVRSGSGRQPHLPAGRPTSIRWWPQPARSPSSRPSTWSASASWTRSHRDSGCVRAADRAVQRSEKHIEFQVTRPRPEVQQGDGPLNPRGAPTTHGRAQYSKGDDPLDPPRRANNTRARAQRYSKGDDPPRTPRRANNTRARTQKYSKGRRPP